MDEMAHCGKTSSDNLFYMGESKEDFLAKEQVKGLAAHILQEVIKACRKNNCRYKINYYRYS